MIKVNVVGQAGWPKDHPWALHQGKLWITLSSAIAMHDSHPDGAVIMWPGREKLLLDEPADKIALQAIRGF